MIVLQDLGAGVDITGGSPQFMDTYLPKSKVEQISNSIKAGVVIVRMQSGATHKISHEYFNAEYKSMHSIADNASLRNHLIQLMIA